MSKVDSIIGRIIIWAIYFYIIYMYNGNLSVKDMLVYGLAGLAQNLFGYYMGFNYCEKGK